MRRSNTLIAAMLVRMGEADAMLCGTVSQPIRHLRYIDEVIGKRPGVNIYAAMNILMLPKHTLFICDTHVNLDPSAEQVAEMTILAAEEMRRFGLTPKVALLSHSNFGSHEDASARKMGRARELLEKLAPELEVEGEMHGDAALSESLRTAAFRLEGRGESAHHAESGCGQYRLQPVENDRGRWHYHRFDSVGGKQIGAYTDYNCHGAPHREYECAGGGWREVTLGRIR